MKQCDRHDEIVEAGRGRAVSEEEEHHVRGCPECYALLASVRALSLEEVAAATESVRYRRLGHSIWSEAKLARERVALRRALRPIRWLEGLAAVLCLGAALWVLPHLSRWGGWLVPVLASSESPASRPWPWPPWACWPLPHTDSVSSAGPHRRSVGLGAGRYRLRYASPSPTGSLPVSTPPSPGLRRGRGRGAFPPGAGRSRRRTETSGSG